MYLKKPALRHEWIRFSIGIETAKERAVKPGFLVPPAKNIPVSRLVDLNDVCAEVIRQHSGKRTSHETGKVENFTSFQGTIHRNPPNVSERFSNVARTEIILQK
jgi:hypothetical protein